MSAPNAPQLTTSPDVITRCIQLKRDVTEQDEFDTGLRMSLNFGHTFGHAVEKFGNYSTFSHGQAVAIGMCVASRLGESIGFTQPGTSDALRQILTRWSLPTELPCPISALKDFMLRDKKASADQIHVVFLKKLGQYEIIAMRFEKLFAILDEAFSERS